MGRRRRNKTNKTSGSDNQDSKKSQMQQQQPPPPQRETQRPCTDCRKPFERSGAVNYFNDCLSRNEQDHAGDNFLLKDNGFCSGCHKVTCFQCLSPCPSLKALMDGNIAFYDTNSEPSDLKLNRLFCGPGRARDMFCSSCLNQHQSRRCTTAFHADVVKRVQPEGYPDFTNRTHCAECGGLQTCDGCGIQGCRFCVQDCESLGMQCRGCRPDSSDEEEEDELISTELARTLTVELTMAKKTAAMQEVDASGTQRVGSCLNAKCINKENKAIKLYPCESCNNSIVKGKDYCRDCVTVQGLCIWCEGTRLLCLDCAPELETCSMLSECGGQFCSADGCGARFMWSCGKCDGKRCKECIVFQGGFTRDCDTCCYSHCQECGCIDDGSDWG